MFLHKQLQTVIQNALYRAKSQSNLETTTQTCDHTLSLIIKQVQDVQNVQDGNET